MAQREVWEREYDTKSLIGGTNEPTQEVKNFFRYLRRECDVDLSKTRLLDLGSGTGKHTHYAATLGIKAVGVELARNALREAQKRAQETGVNLEYREGDIGKSLPFKDASFDVVLDVMSSNSLNEDERALYLAEADRVLAPRGFMLVRGLAKEGDRHAKTLLRDAPGTEHDTYVLPGLHVTERVFTEADLRALYGAHFSILHYKRSLHYARFAGRSFKRAYFVLYLQKPT